MGHLGQGNQERWMGSHLCGKLESERLRTGLWVSPTLAERGLQCHQEDSRGSAPVPPTPAPSLG